MRNLKRVLSLALALVMVLGMMVIGTSAATFTDDAEIEYKEAIAVMNGIDLFRGNPDGSMTPKQVLTRGMAATILARVMLGEKVDTLKATQQIFSDVALDKYYAPAVQYCFNTGLIDGYGDGTFNPDGELTGIAFAKLLLVALGFDADAQGYVGDNWAANIAVDALAKDLYIKGVDIAEKLTREQAAQMLLQVMDENMVYNVKFFDKATNSYSLILGGDIDTTFMDKYYEDLDRDDTDGVYDNWGRPYDYAWYYEGVGYLWVEEYAPVATYTEAVVECDIAKDLKINTPKSATVTLNGNDAGSVTIHPLYQYDTIGAQGRLTEVYKTENGFEMVMIDTFLAQVTKVQDRVWDRNGHLKYSAKLYLNIFDGNGTNGYTYVTLQDSFADWEYAKGDMLLVYAETKTAENDAVEYGDAMCVEILGTVEGTLAKLNSFNTYYETSKISGQTYDWAVQYHEGNTGAAGASYYVYTDMYGNLLGLISPAGADAVYTILDSGVFVTNGYNPYFAGKVLNMETGELEEIKVAAYNTDEHLGWADDKVTNVKHIVEYAVTGKGYVMVDAADEYYNDVDVDIAAGTPRIYVNDDVVAVTDNSTIFAVEVANGQYKLYTGYKSIPSIENAENVEILLGSNGYADLVYVDATNAVYTGAADVVYVLEGDCEVIGSGVTDGYVRYDIFGGVIADGVATVVDTVKGFDLSAYEGKAVKLFYNADGLVFKAVEYEFGFDDLTVEYNNSDEVVYFEGIKQGYIVDDETVIWVIDEYYGSCYVGDARDLARGTENVYVDVAKDGKTLDFVVIIEE